MNLTRGLFLFCFALFLSCSKDAKQNSKSYLIEFEEFLALSKQKNVKIIDFTKPNNYAKGHIKNAINLWRTDIEDSSYSYGGMMASKKQIEKLFSKIGVTNKDLLLVYDDKGLCDATRLWWVLQNYGFTNLKMLNGGMRTWVNNGMELTKKNPTLTTSTFTFSPTKVSKIKVAKEEVFAAMLNSTTIVDTRTASEFSGKVQKKGAFKAGRIPNSILIDWANAIDYNGSRKLKSTEELEAIYNRLGKSKKDTIIIYCHSGVRSSHTTFVLTQLLGYKNVYNYDGSWTEWSYFNDYPFEKDSITIK